MGGDPRNPAPRSHFSVWIVKPSGCHCTDAFGGRNIVECRPLSGALPFLWEEQDPKASCNLRYARRHGMLHRGIRIARVHTYTYMHMHKEAHTYRGM